MSLPLCRNHEKTTPLARLGNAFRVEATGVGLWVEVDTDAMDDYGDELLGAFRARAFKAWSISFRATKVRWNRTGYQPLRIVEAARLLEISIADCGAHDTTIGILSRMRQAE
jgi:HK97 family phage prohead protease